MRSSHRSALWPILASVVLAGTLLSPLSPVAPTAAEAAEPLWYGTMKTVYEGAGRVPTKETVTYTLHPSAPDPETGWTQNVSWTATYDDRQSGNDCTYTWDGDGAGGPEMGAYIGPGPELYTIVARVSDATKYDVVMTGTGSNPDCIGVSFQTIPLGFTSELTTATEVNGVKALQGSRTDSNGGTFTWDLRQGSLADLACTEEKTTAAAVHAELLIARAYLLINTEALRSYLALPKDQRTKEGERQMRLLVKHFQGEVRELSKDAAFWDAIVKACLANALSSTSSQAALS